MKSRRQSAQKESRPRKARRVCDSQKTDTTSEESLRLAFESAPIGMAIVDADYRLQRVNRSLCETLGYDATELLQRKLVDLAHPDDIARDTMLVRKLFRGK